MRVVVLHSPVQPDAGPDELDTLVQVEAVTRALRELSHAPSALPCSLDLEDVRRRLRAAAPDMVFNLVESLAGTGRLLAVGPALLEHMGLPFCGSPSDALFVTSHKVLAKTLLSLSGLPTPAWVTPEGLRRGEPVPPGRLIIKSTWEHASVGLDEGSLVQPPCPPAALAEILGQRRERLGGDCFAESFVPGRELNLSIIEGSKGEPGPVVLPPAEMCFEGYPEGKPHLVGYRAKWEPGSFEYEHTRRSFTFPAKDDALLQRLRQLALRCFDLFGLRGWARVDFRVDPLGQPHILEVNANPCLSPDAGFAAAASEAKMSQTEVVERILRATR